MSWFGEQLNSITGKLTDLGKDVFNDNGELKGSEGLIPANQNGLPSRNEILELCKEKEDKVKVLMEENSSLEKSIIELDQQHQDAINELLSSRAQIIKENNDLKNMMTQQKFQHQTNTPGPLLQNFDCSSFGNSVKMRFSDQSETFNLDSLTKHINSLQLLSSLKNSMNSDDINVQISWLESQEQWLINHNSPDKNLHLLEKIKNYIKCLKIISDNDVFLPVFQEITSLLDAFNFDNASLKGKLAALDSVVENYELNACDSVSNFNVDSDDKISKCHVDFSNQTDCFNVNSFESVHCQTLGTKTIDIYSQTEEPKCETCQLKNNLISQLEYDVLSLRQEICLLEKQIMDMKCVSEKPSVFAQTDETSDNLCKYRELELELEEMKAMQSDMQNKFTKKEELFDVSLKKHLEALNDLNFKLSSQEKFILEKEDCTASQEKEITRLKSEVNTLENELNMLRNELEEDKELDTHENQNGKHFVDNSFNSSNIVNGNTLQNEMSTALQEMLKTSEFEKNKLLCVLNEKSQECSNLKAEVHKLTSIVASEKQALLKLQHDNCELKLSNKDTVDIELTKEAVQNLSRLVRDKDLEIDSMKQKNATLTALIAEASSVPEQLQSLIEERESLTKQVNMYKADREKIMALYNAKDQECCQQLEDIKKLNSSWSSQTEEHDILQQEHQSLVQQYEEKQKSLVKAQNELIAMNQTVTSLEHQQVDIKEKYSELLNKMNSDSMVQIAREDLSSKIGDIERLTISNAEKDNLIQEKDCMIHDLSQQVKKMILEVEGYEIKILDLQKDITETREKLKASEVILMELQTNRDITEQRLADKNSELSLVKEMNERLNMTIKEKEFSMQTMTEKISSLFQYINKSADSAQSSDINQILADSETLFSKAQSIYKERDETVLALSQCQQECQSLRNEIQRMKSCEIKLNGELGRLRQHLIEIEDNYTSEALKAEEKVQKLRNELFEVSRRAEISSTAVVDTNQRATVQIASLQEQLTMVAKQREEALSQVSALEDKVQQRTTSVNNLQFVLEQIQRSTERKITETENKWQAILEKEKETHSSLKNELETKKMQLKESSQALEVATRLSEQLEAKEEVISSLKNELKKADHKMKSTAQEIDSIRSNTEGKVDRIVMKSLVLGYFSTPPGQRSEVVRLLARVLDFNQEEMEKAGIVVQRNTGRTEQRGIFSSIFGRWPSTSDNQPVHNQQLQKSFTTLFVQFLENESKPIVPIPFPVEKMTNELTFKSNKGPQSSQKRLMSGNSPLLLNIDSTFPTFTPVPAVEYTKSPAPAILKEVLQ